MRGFIFAHPIKLNFMTYSERLTDRITEAFKISNRRKKIFLAITFAKLKNVLSADNDKIDK